MNSVSYIRISTPNQLSGHSIEAQKNICQQYANQNNLNISKEYVDIGSGKKMKNLENLNKLIEENEDCTMLIVNVDRFSRNTYEGIEYLNKLKKKKIKLYSIEQNVSSENISGLRLIKNYLNDSEFESNTISERVSKSLKLIIDKGGFIGVPRFGYSKCKLNNIPVLVKNKSEQEIIKFIIDSRIGLKSSTKLSVQLKKITKNSKLPKLNFYSKDNIEIETFDKPFTLTFNEISDILNDYKIKNRNKKFKGNSVRNIFKKNCSLNVINKIKKFNNIIDINNQMKNLSL